jgi:hypothetical protein
MKKQLIIAALFALPFAGLMAQEVTPVNPTTPVVPAGSGGGGAPDNDRNLPLEIRAQNSVDWMNQNFGPLDPRASQCVLMANQSFLQSTRDAVNNTPSDPTRQAFLMNEARNRREQQLRSCLMPHQYDRLRALRPAIGFNADGTPQQTPAIAPDGTAGGTPVTTAPPPPAARPTPVAPSRRPARNAPPARGGATTPPVSVGPPAPVAPGAGGMMPNDRLEGERP